MDCFAQVLLEKQNNQTVAAYTYGDDLISQNVAGGTSYFGYDGLGSTKFLTDTQGQITDTYQYDAYGEITSKTGTTDNNYLYTGEQYDRSLNQYYLRARYYNQGVGRFTQMDTWQGIPTRPSSLNKYVYTEGNPVMNVDPSGHFLAGISLGSSLRASMSSMSVTSYTPVLAKVGVRLLRSGVLSSNTKSVINILQNTETGKKQLEEARAKLKEKVEKKDKNKKGILFHYSSATATAAIASMQCIFASKPYYGHPDGQKRPAGAYATHFQPWFPMRQSDLRSFIYAKRPRADVSWFVALKDDGFRILGAESYKPGLWGSCVPVKVIYRGPNLMLPD